MSKSKPKFKVGDKVRILDGSKIENYAGRWIGNDDPLARIFCPKGILEKRSMEAHVGEIGTIESSKELSDGRIAYSLKEYDYAWDERGLESAEEVSPASENHVIVIYRKDQEVIALDKTTGRKATAKCLPEDDFDFYTGAKLAFDRLLSKKPKFKVGDRVIGTDLASEYYYTTCKGWKGVVVEVLEDGYIKVRGKLKSFPNMHSQFIVESKAFELDNSQRKHK